MPSSHSLDRVDVSFDHQHAVADAGLLLTGSLVGRLGLEQLIDDTVSLGHRPGRKLLTLAHTLVAGGDCIDDAAMLQAGATGALDAGHVDANGDVRAPAPDRPGHRARDGSGVGGRSRPQRRADVHRCRLDHL